MARAKQSEKQPVAKTKANAPESVKVKAEGLTPAAFQLFDEPAPNPSDVVDALAEIGVEQFTEDRSETNPDRARRTPVTDEEESPEEAPADDEGEPAERDNPMADSLDDLLSGLLDEAGIGAEEADDTAAEDADVEGADESEPVDVSELIDADATYKVGDTELTGAELEAGYLRQADYTRKTQEVAQQRREVEQAADVIRAEAQRYHQRLGVIEQAFAQLGAGPEMLQRVNAEAARVEAAIQTEAKNRLVQMIETERDLLAKAAPDFGKEERAAVRDYALDVGFTADELTNLADHRAMLVLRDAKRYRDMKAKSESAQARVKRATSKTIRPSGKPPRSSKGKSKINHGAGASMGLSGQRAAVVDALSTLFD